MKRLLILGAVCALTVAKPELYKEKEDFQFSRSSSDDGSKSGFYGAQRGNMGGNYERAHNMDSLAQNQMSGLVQQVEGELGDGAKTRTGSVYTAANSRGTYGSGHFDLSNLAGRNFQEGTSYGDSQSSHSASSAYNAAAYSNSRSQSSRHSGYQATGHSGVNLQSDDLQALTDHSQRTGQYDYGRHTSQAAGYNAQSGYQQRAAYDVSNTNLHSGDYGSNVQTRLISATPVRVIVRPGGRVAIPLAAQTYDLTQGSALLDQNSLNTDAEVLSSNNQRNVHYVPSSAKHYESSYNYRKEWEKHDTIPATIFTPTSTDSPFPKNSELNEDGQSLHVGNQQYDTRRVESQRAQSAYGGYNAAVKSTSGQSRFNYDTQRNAASYTNGNAYSMAGYGTNHQDTSSDSSSNGYNIQSQYNGGRYRAASADALTQSAVHNSRINAAADLNSQVENVNAKPKSYQSSYSYHKSWERQGDPYVIKPASSAYYDGQSSQKLTTGSTQNLGYLTTGSHYQHSHGSGADCDENGHIRVARSYNTDQFQDMQQQSQNLEDLSQQQSQNLDTFGEQQQSQNLEDFGHQQQSQNLEDFGQQQQSQHLDDFYNQQQQSQKLEDFGQQQQKQNLEDLGQKVENLGQQTEVQWESQQEGGQQTQNTWDNLENLSQQTHKKWDDMQHTWDKFEDLEQKPQENQNGLLKRPQHTETKLKNNTEDQQAQDFNKFQNQDEQQSVSTHGQVHEQSNKLNQQETQPQLSDDDIFNYSQQSQKHNNDQMSVWDKVDLRSDQSIQQHKYQSEHTNSYGNQVNRSFLSQQLGLGQQSLNSEFNRESQSVYNNDSNGSTAEQVTSTTQFNRIPDTEQSNIRTNNTHDGNFNIHDQNQHQKEENSSEYQSSYGYFSSGQRQEQTTNTDSYSHVNTFDTISPNIAPLAGLWNKLGNLEQTFATSEVNKGDGHAYSQVHTNTQNSYGNSLHAYHNVESKLYDGDYDLTIDTAPLIEKDTSQNKSNVTKTENESSRDVGRGDISPEDLSASTPEEHPINTPGTSEMVQNQNKNSENITYTRNNQDIEHTDNTHGQHNFHQHHDFQEQKDAENTDQRNLHVLSLNKTNVQPNQPVPNLVQHNVQDYGKSFEQQNHLNVSQQENKEHNLSDFGQQTKDEQQNLQDFGEQNNLQHQNLHDFGHQVNVEQQNLQDFGKQDNLEQQNLQDFGQQVNVEQQNLQDFGEQDNLQQQNLQDFGHQVNVEQQNLQDFGKQDNLEQQNLQDFGQKVNVEQQNLQEFGKQDNLEQQSLQDFGQQVNVEKQDFVKQDNMEQQNLQDFGEQDNLQQQNLQDFGHQVNVEQQNLQDFGKQDNLEQQNLQDFGQKVNVEQQNLQEFGKLDNLEQQNLQDFGQQVNVEKQDFVKQDNLEQQNLQDFGHQVNVEQQNLQDFEKQDNLEQQNLQDFGQQVNVEQQSLQEFGKQHNFEQQNLQDFGQQVKVEKQDFVKQDNLEQQNLQDFGHQAYLEQHNLQYFRSLGDLQHQDKKLEHLSQDPKQHSKQERTEPPKNNLQSETHLPHPKEIEQPIVKKQSNDLHLISEQTQSTETTPEEPVTESTGFWKSVGNKLTRAKSKIASWF